MTTTLNELDYQIGEQVMGWFRHKGMTHGKAQEVLSSHDGSTRSVECGCVEDFNPSVDIADAFEVVEHMRRAGRAITIEGSSGEGGWYVTFQPRAFPNAASCGPDLPDCICRAALQAVKDPNSEHITK